VATNQIDLTIGNRLQELIETLKKEGFADAKGKMNSGVFAESVGIDPSQFSKMKSGDVGITLEQILEISSIYNVSMEWIIAGSGPVFKSSTLSINEDDPGYQKTTGTHGIPADVLTLLQEEVSTMQVSLERIAKVVGVPDESGRITGPPPMGDLGLDKRKRTLNNGKSKSSKRGI
jgi:hypothetical protein